MQKVLKNMDKTKQKVANLNTESRLSKARKSSKLSNSSRLKSHRKKKPCNEDCKKHNFDLKPIAFSSFLSKGITQPILVNFCSKGNSSTLPIISKQLLKEPQVPLFLLQDEIYRYQYYLQSHREQFTEAINKAEKMVGSEEEQQLMIPVPKNKNCQICRIRIETEDQYHKHIKCNEHHQILQKSVGQKLIIEETGKLVNERKISKECNETLNRLKQASHILIQAKKTLKGLLVKREGRN